MKKRSFDEMIAYFNHRVADMNISQDYKMELLGMVTALGYKHEKTAQQWILCSERVPEEDEQVLVYLYDSPYIAWIDSNGEWNTEDFTLDKEEDREDEPIAWMPLPEPYREGEQDENR